METPATKRLLRDFKKLQKEGLQVSTGCLKTTIPDDSPWEGESVDDVSAILTSIQSLLCDPNPNSPANAEAAKMFTENKREYNRRVKEMVGTED
ncbi:hypothetical protein V6N12_000816 [Hibiscus sabdariffa]|uniref:UBC core domain-containing protein n=1 Tax=Hibiscus sabdariffa TaxID=183260 RepID=A0ABR2BXH8_9ROSI